MTRPLALDRTCCQSCLPVLLQPEEHNDQWYDTQQRTEHDCTSLRSKVGHHAIQTQGHGLVFFRGHHHQRQEEVIPCCDEDEEENGDHCRSQNTQNHGEEDTCFRCPVNAGSFNEFCGNRVLRTNASREQSKGADTRRDDDRLRGVSDTNIVEDQVQRNCQQCCWHKQTRHDHCEGETTAGESKLRHSIASHH